MCGQMHNAFVAASGRIRGYKTHRIVTTQDMLDAPLRRLADPPLNLAAKRVAALGIGANAWTLAGFVLGLAAAASIASGRPLIGLAFLALNRLCDGLDGAVARQTKPTDLGGFLDIALDLIVFAGVPFAFALADPSRALAAIFLVFSFVASGSTVLAYGLVAARRGLPTETVGLVENSETTIAFALACIFPASFSIVAYVLGMLCFVTAGMRVASAVSALGDA